MYEPELELTPEQLAGEIKKLRVGDLVLSTVTTLAQLAYAKLAESSRDLEEARLAIDTIQVLLPTLDGHVLAELALDLGGMLAELQVAFASASSGSPGPSA